MRGSIIEFDRRSGSGVIRGEDRRHYAFEHADWALPHPPVARQRVDFEVEDLRARTVRPEAEAVHAPPSEPQPFTFVPLILGALACVLAVIGVMFRVYGLPFAAFGLYLGIKAWQASRPSEEVFGQILGMIGVLIALTHVLVFGMVFMLGGFFAP